MAWSDYPDARWSIGLLRRSLEQGRLGHAYLFAGDDADILEGVALELAMAVNCGASVEGAGSDVRRSNACGTCSSCRRIRSRVHPDVYWLRAESKSRIMRVEQVRELIQAVHLKPTEAPYKVGVLVGAERLTPQAGNAFLKTLEEPPARSLLILLSTEPDRLIETIQSRCLRLAFPGQAPRDTRQLAWLAQFADGLQEPAKSLLNRYRVLDVLLRQLADIRSDAENLVEARSSGAEPGEVDAGVREQRDDEAKAAVEAEYRRRRGEVLQLAEGWFRDVWLTTEHQPPDLLAFPDLIQATTGLARRLNPEQALANLQLLEGTHSLLHTNVQEALALEVALLRLQL